MYRKITVALIKQALQHMRVRLGGATSKADLGKLLATNLNKTQPNEDDADKEIALSVLNRWFMAPIKGDATTLWERTNLMEKTVFGS